MKVMTGLDLQNQRITALADPSANTDAATKQYVDNVARGLFWKDAVKVATTTNGTLATAFANGQVIDGVTLVTGDRILLKDQTTASQNGIYVVNASGAPTRAADADNGTELAPGTAVTVTQGTVNGDRVYIITSDTPITVGVTAMTWSQLGGGGGSTYTNGTGLTLTGNVFAIDTGVVARKMSANVGNGSLTNIAVTHNLGTLDVAVSVREVATNALVLVDWVATDINTVTLQFATAPAANAFRATIIG